MRVWLRTKKKCSTSNRTSSRSKVNVRLKARFQKATEYADDFNGKVHRKEKTSAHTHAQKTDKKLS